MPTLRILQLLEPCACWETRRCAAALAEGLGEGFVVEQRVADRAGLWRQLPGRLLGARPIERFDVVHVWGAGPLLAAALGTRGPIVLSPAPELSGRSIGWLRAVMSQREVDVVCPSRAAQRALLERGIAPERCHLVRPGVDFGRVRRRPAGRPRAMPLRQRMGLSPEDRVLLAVGESTEAAAHDQAIWAASILHVRNSRYKAVLWGRGPLADRLRRLGARLYHSNPLRLAEERGGPVRWEDLLAEADVGVISATRMVATLPVATAMASGLPLVATATPAISELLENQHTAVLSPAGSPRLLAQRTLELLEDPGAQYRLADMARVEAFEYFSLQRFLEQWRLAYRQCASGEPVSLPEPQPGAGLRFHGRG